MTSTEVVAADKPVTDNEIADRATDLLLQAAQVLSQHSTNADYHMTVIQMAARDIRSAAQMLQHLKGPIPQPYRPGLSQGPGEGWKNGPRRFRVEVKLKRPALLDGAEFEAAAVKKMERARFFDYGSAAARHAETYAYQIGNWVDAVHVTDRLDKVLWTYDNDANCVEIPFGEEPTS